MRLRLLAAAAVLVYASAAAYASPATFDLSAALSNGNATGSITIDPSTGQVLGGDVVANTGGTSYNLSNLFEQGPETPVYQIGFNNSTGDTFYLTLPDLSTLIGYNGSTLCGTSNFEGCFVPGTNEVYFYVAALVTGQGQQVNVSSGSLAPAPEPSSLLLLGSSTIGAAGLLRRRMRYS